jgi:hypothetical protein
MGPVHGLDTDIPLVQYGIYGEFPDEQHGPRGKRIAFVESIMKRGGARIEHGKTQEHENDFSSHSYLLEFESGGFPILEGLLRDYEKNSISFIG